MKFCKIQCTKLYLIIHSGVQLDNYDSTFLYVIVYKKYAIIEQEQNLTRGELLTTIPNLYKEYEVKFEVMPFRFPSGWSSLIHLTIDGDHGKYGERNPAIFVYGSSPPFLTVASAVNGNVNEHKNYTGINGIVGISTNIWIKITVAQKLEHEYYNYTVKIDNNLIYSAENKEPVDLTDVKVYASDPWYVPLNGYIRRLEISTIGIKYLTNYYF